MPAEAKAEENFLIFFKPTPCRLSPAVLFMIREQGEPAIEGVSLPGIEYIPGRKGRNKEKSPSTEGEPHGMVAVPTKPNQEAERKRIWMK